MDDHAIRERSDSEVEPTDRGETSRLQAAVGEWQAWLVGAVALLAAGYFHVTEEIWPTTAESFYALIFAGVAVVVLGYGVFEVRSRSPLV